MEKTNNIPDFLQNIPGQNINEVNKKKLELINIITLAVSSKYKDDESIVYDCLKNLIYLLYKKDNDVNVLVGDILPESNYKYKQIKLSNNLYKIVDNRVKLVPILYLKQDDELIYYIWCADNGLQPISKNEITKKIQEGEFHIKDNKSLHKKMAIQFFADGQSAGR